MECLEIARRLYDLTGGAFDVSLGSGFDRLELVAGDLTVRAGADGIRLDLGGIGKGYAVDRMAEVLEEWEVRRALVHGGFSSVLVLEAPPDRDGWPLTLRAPGDGAVLARVSACRRVFSASGTRKGDHIRDPRTGRAAHDRAAWVSLPRDAGWPASVAEGLSTAFMILAVEEVAGLCAREPRIEAWLVREPAEDGRAATLLHLPTTGA
jgi:thiamine biosynthesis lipoprotein